MPCTRGDPGAQVEAQLDVRELQFRAQGGVWGEGSERRQLGCPKGSGSVAGCVCVCLFSLSNSLPPRGLPARLLCPWNTPDKNAGMGCHFLLQGIFATEGSNQSPVSHALAGGFFTTESLEK